MSKNPPNINEFLQLREVMLRHLGSKKVSPEEFSDKLFGKINFRTNFAIIREPTTKEEMFFNYVYWTTLIEHKWVNEQRLYGVGLGASWSYRLAIEKYIHNRDKCAIRYLRRYKSLILSTHIICEDHVVAFFKHDYFVFLRLSALPANIVLSNRPPGNTFYSEKFLIVNKQKTTL